MIIISPNYVANHKQNLRTYNVHAMSFTPEEIFDEASGLDDDGGAGGDDDEDGDDGDDGDHLERLLSTKRLQGRRWWRSKPKQLL